MQSAAKKLQFKGQKPAILFNAPPEAAGLGKALGSGTGVGKAAFLLCFAKDLGEAGLAFKAAGTSLQPGAVFWVAYPKGSSKKYPKVPVNRDSLHELGEDFDFVGVSLVALDADWSAMRFKTHPAPKPKKPPKPGKPS